MIPETFPGKVLDWKRFDVDDSFDQYKLRDEWLKKGMFAFVSKEWTKPLVQWIGKRKCLEVMAGAGWLAKALSDDGVNIIATDNHSWINDRGWVKMFDVEELDAIQSVILYGHNIDILIISWPYMDNVAFQTIKQLHIQNPNSLIIYIGENYGGCTADDEFFEHFEEIEDEKFNKATSNFKSWWGIHDHIYLGKFKP
jgi:hypothetical protein